jgi:hypothetical protein
MSLWDRVGSEGSSFGRDVVCELGVFPLDIFMAGDNARRVLFVWVGCICKSWSVVFVSL